MDPAADPSKRLQRQLRFQQFCQHGGPSRSPHQRGLVCVCGHSAVRRYMSGGQWRSVNLSGSCEEVVLPSGCYVFRGRLRRGSGWPIYQSQRFHPVDFVHESCGRCQRHAVVNWTFLKIEICDVPLNLWGKKEKNDGNNGRKWMNEWITKQKQLFDGEDGGGASSILANYQSTNMGQRDLIRGRKS